MTDFVNPNAKYFNAFNLIENIGPIAFKKILSYFKSIDIAWKAGIDEFRKAGLNQKTIEEIKKRRCKIDPNHEMRRLEKEKIGLITIKDESYPRPLKEIYAPPMVLYVKGNFDLEKEPGLAVIGTRTPSYYGEKTTPLIISQLRKTNLTVVSGLAKGIDSLAHQSALKNKMKTIAVLGTGLDSESVYPRANKNLAQEISENGALISEFPIKTKPTPQNFPQRNRIISGLSLGVLVIESSEKSGTMITIKNAIEQNRDIFAVPGNINSENSKGPNYLIKKGAKLVSGANDILEELKFKL